MICKGSVLRLSVCSVTPYICVMEDVSSMDKQLRLASSRVWLSLILIHLAILSGCQTGRQSAILKPSQPTFREQYERIRKDNQQIDIPLPGEAKTISFQAQGMPLHRVLRELSIITGEIIIPGPGYEMISITTDLRQVSLTEALKVIARISGLQVITLDNGYLIGDPRPEDRRVVVRRVPSLEPEEIESVFYPMVSDTGSISVVGNGTLIVSDSDSAIEKIDEVIESIGGNSVSTWVIQLYLISIEQKAKQEFGFDAIPSIEVAANFALGSSRLAALSSLPSESGVSLKGGLQALIKAANENSGVKLVAEPLFFMADGSDVYFQRGSQIPVARRVVSDQGTVSTAGFDMLQTGIIIDMNMRETSGESARLDMEVQIASTSDSVEGVPIIKREAYNGVVEVQDDGVYLIGELQRNASSKIEKFGLESLLDNSSENTVVQIWVRARKVR